MFFDNRRNMLQPTASFSDVPSPSFSHTWPCARQAMPKLPAAKRPRERGEAPSSPRAKAKAKATAACAKRAPKARKVKK